MAYDSKDLTEMSNAVRADALRAILSAQSGHVGIVLGAANIITTIYANFIQPGLDRFVLSAGHGSAMLYSILKLSGHNIERLDKFRKIGGLPGHPEYGIHGVSATTGPLGQGVANAVGMALAEKIKGGAGRVYCLCGDGDLSEGIAQEAIAFAGRYKLNNLVLLWDNNGLTIDGVAQTDLDVLSRMRAAGWTVAESSGDDFDTLNRILRGAPRARLPLFISVKTNLGNGSSMANMAGVHGYGLPDGELSDLIKKYSGKRGYDLWREFADTHIWPAEEEKETIHIPDINWMPDSAHISTRELSGLYLDVLLKNGVNLICGSADLGHSTNIRTASAVDIAPGNFVGNYINYGVREHAMAGIMNGMAASGVRVVGSTFLVFSDYMRGAMRMSAMSGLPVIYVLTHDSITVGEDGPTHQPIEHLPSLRLIPNMNVFRPCNGIEVEYAWRCALSDNNRPTCIILSRQKFDMIPTPSGTDVRRGAYIIRKTARAHVRATIIATGAEVSLAIAVAEKLGSTVQVVSMPSVADFRAQDAQYKATILRGTVFAIEASSPTPWFEFADAVVGINEFGISGPGADVYRHCGFDADAIARDIELKIK